MLSVIPSWKRVADNSRNPALPNRRIERGDKFFVLDQQQTEGTASRQSCIGDPVLAQPVPCWITVFDEAAGRLDDSPAHVGFATLPSRKVRDIGCERISVMAGIRLKAKYAGHFDKRV